MSLKSLSDFLKNSGMRKVGSGLYIYTLNAVLLYLKAMTGEEFKALGVIVVLALMGANAYEHHNKNKSKEQPNAEQKPTE